MKLLEERILKEGVIKPSNVLKVDSFLNHQMDPMLFDEMAKVFKDYFKDKPINKILTIEASGIGIAILVGLYFKVPVVFAKKSKTQNMSDDVYHTSVYSYTHQLQNEVMVSKQYLHADDHILIIDDFLANGCALEGLIDLVHQAHGHVEGIGIVIEKGFQDGGQKIRQLGYPLKSLAIIEHMDAENKTILFK